MALPKPTEVTAIDAVFETLLKDIVGGSYPSGTRLPAERELARQLGASRPTLREALRRLGEWNLVEPGAARASSCGRTATGRSRCSRQYLRYGRPRSAPARHPAHAARRAGDAARQSR